jgi:hypothetical protein
MIDMVPIQVFWLHGVTIVVVGVLSLIGACGAIGMLMAADQMGIPLYVPALLALPYFVGVIIVGLIVEVKMKPR